MRKPTMTKEQEIYYYLCENHVGIENIISNYELRIKFGVYSDKSLRDIIKRIRKDKTMLEIVASKSGKSGGYWIATSKEDCINTMNHLRHRAGDIYKTAHIIDWKAEQKYGKI